MPLQNDSNNPNQNLVELIATLQMGNQNAATIAHAIKSAFASQSGQNTSLSIAYSTTASSSGGTFIASSVSYLTSIMVTVSSTATTGTGKVYDCGSIANAGSSNQFATIPSSGTVTLNWPIKYGLVVQPSSLSQVVAVSYV